MSNKNLRNNFGYRVLASVSPAHSLVDIQKKSYSNFLNSSDSETANIGDVFKSMFPVTDVFGYASIDFVQYRLSDPVFDVDDCKRKSITYASDVYITIRFTIFNKDQESGEVEIRSVKEQEILLCSIPLMTDNATFVINGFERVIVSQIHRSPGIFFVRDVVGNASSYAANVIPYRGSWLSITFDSKDSMIFKIDKKRKMPIFYLLSAMKMKIDDIIGSFYQSLEVKFDKKINLWSIKLDENMLGSYSSCDIFDKSGDIILGLGKIINRKILKNLSENGSICYIKTEDLCKFYLFENQVIEGNDVYSSGGLISGSFLSNIAKFNIDTIFVINSLHKDYSPVILNSVLPYADVSYDEVMQMILKIIRPGEPFSLDEAEKYFNNLFFNQQYYNLLGVGRYKINKSFGLNDKESDSLVLTKKDIIMTIGKLALLKEKNLQADDIDHLSNRRVRSVGELLENQFRIGLSKVVRSASEKLNSVSLEIAVPSDLISNGPIVKSVKDFFMVSQLSQFMDQTNPLSELAHKRRISSLGVGGLNKERAGFEVRDVHPTHYGRICPIETPEGQNIGLIGSLATYAAINKYGFIETPYRKVEENKITDKIEFLDASSEYNYYISQIDNNNGKSGVFSKEIISARKDGEFVMAQSSYVQYADVSPKQIVSVVASLIPFLENDDAKRALMGSNMQRQAVPLISSEAPLVGTGMESFITKDSGAIIAAKRDGVVSYVDSTMIIVRVKNDKKYEMDCYDLKKFARSNHSTCVNQVSIVSIGDNVVSGDVIADGPAVSNGEIALGKNLFVAFMPWKGFNFEDSIAISEKLSKNDAFTSIHIEEFEITVRDTRLGAEEITRDIPGLSTEYMRFLDETGIVHNGVNVGPGDILVGKVTPKSEVPITAEEKLLRAIFGEKVAEVKDSSLRVPPGVFGTVVGVNILTRRGNAVDARAKQHEIIAIDKIKQSYQNKVNVINDFFEKELESLIIDSEITIVSKDKKKNGKKIIITKDNICEFSVKEKLSFIVLSSEKQEKIIHFKNEYLSVCDLMKKTSEEKIAKLLEGEDLAAGVLKVIRVYIATKSKLQPGDKMAGRHGNKGVVARIVPVGDMPFLKDGTPVDIVLNPIGVAARMNIGQIMETHLGFASLLLGKKIDEMLKRQAESTEISAFLDVALTDENLKQRIKEMSKSEVMNVAESYRNGIPFATPVFEGPSTETIEKMIESGGGDKSGQVDLYDGYTGDKFDRKVTVGCIYMMKLHHLVDNKIHARSIGPYSLVTQQPLGGKSHFGGQRFGEMECWAIQAYGAAYTLQEMLTVKSDDTDGRNKMYESIVKGEMNFDCGVPESFNVLFKELRSLCLNVRLESNE